MKVPMYSQSGDKLQEIEVSESVFGVESHNALVHAAVVRHLANGRQGSAATKTRGEVAGGGRKPWRQKGTGRARHGSIRSPIWRGGGVTFGPQPRDFSLGMPKRARRQALLAAVSAKAQDGAMVVIDQLAMAKPSTKQFAQAVSAIAGDRSTLVVIASPDKAIWLSARNLPAVRVIEARNLNVYDVVKYQQLLVTKDALAKLEEVLAS
jgi:large subunit ribosomal protein L4